MTLDLEEAGFSFSGGSGEDARAANAALRDCIAQIDPARLQPPPALASEQLVSWYAYRVRQADCLRSAGYGVPDPPPQQVFADTAGAWDPFDALLRSGINVAPADFLRCQRLEGEPPFLSW